MTDPLRKGLEKLRADVHLAYEAARTDTGVAHPICLRRFRDTIDRLLSQEGGEQQGEVLRDLAMLRDDDTVFEEIRHIAGRAYTALADPFHNPQEENDG